MKKHMKLTAAALAAAMAFSMTACSGGTDTASGSQTSGTGETGGASQEEYTEEVTLKVANYAILESGYTEFWEGVKAGFEEKYPNVTIEWVTAPYGEITNQVINMAGGGDMVDVIFSELIWIPTFVEAGLAAPAEEMLDADFLADFYPNVLEAHQVDGQTYGVPLYASSCVLYYNKDIFEAAGLDPNTPPTTYDEMLQMAEKIDGMTTADGNKIYAFGVPTASVAVVGSFLNSVVYNYGGTVLTEDGSLAIDDGFKQAFDMIKLLDDKGYNPQNCKPKDLRNLFALGQLAMYYDQSWGFNGVSSINPDAANFTASAMPLKGGDGDGAGTLQSHCFVMVNNGGARAWAAKEFVQYVITPEVLNDYMNNITPAYPVKNDMVDCMPELLVPSADATTQAKPVPLVAALNDFNLELCTLAQAVTVSDKDVDTAIADFETSANAILAG